MLLGFKLVDWAALAKTIPTMFALSFFGIIHVPINVPALGVAVQEDDVNINRELIAHGISNAVSGFVGSIQVCVQLRAWWQQLIQSPELFGLRQ